MKASNNPNKISYDIDNDSLWILDDGNKIPCKILDSDRAMVRSVIANIPPVNIRKDGLWNKVKKIFNFFK